jgi:hypothetical protein
MRSYFQGILTGIAISVSILLLIGAQKDRSSIILEMIIEDQKADIILKNQVKENNFKIKSTHKMMDEKFRNIYRYLGENCPCFDNLPETF